METVSSLKFNSVYAERCDASSSDCQCRCQHKCKENGSDQRAWKRSNDCKSWKAAFLRYCALRRTVLVLPVGVVSAMVPQHAYHGWRSASATSTDSSNEDKPEFQRRLMIAQRKTIYLHVDYRTVQHSPSLPPTFLPSAH